MSAHISLESTPKQLKNKSQNYGNQVAAARNDEEGRDFALFLS
jgi:hypothetical protein